MATRGDTTPWSVWLAVCGWYIVASALFLRALAPGGRQSVTGAFGTDLVVSDVSSWPAMIPMAGGLVVLGLALFLVWGHWWALPSVTALGALATIALAASGGADSLAVMAGLVLGTAPLLLSPRALNYLRPATTAVPHE